MQMQNNGENSINVPNLVVNGGKVTNKMINNPPKSKKRKKNKQKVARIETGSNDESNDKQKKNKSKSNKHRRHSYVRTEQENRLLKKTLISILNQRSITDTSSNTSNERRMSRRTRTYSSSTVDSPSSNYDSRRRSRRDRNNSNSRHRDDLWADRRDRRRGSDLGSSDRTRSGKESSETSVDPCSDPDDDEGYYNQLMSNRNNHKDSSRSRSRNRKRGSSPSLDSTN